MKIYLAIDRFRPYKDFEIGKNGNHYYIFKDKKRVNPLGYRKLWEAKEWIDNKTKATKEEKYEGI
jgi:hypothetical protein